MTDALLWDPANPDHQADPYSRYDLLRRTAPAWRSPQGYWVLSRYADIAVALADPRLISNDTSGGAKVAPPGPDVLPPVGERTAEFFTHWMTFSSTEADHRRLRKLYLAGFTPTLMRAFRGRLADLVVETLDPLRDLAGFDFMTTFAAQLPVAAICEVLGVPAELRSVMHALATPLARAFHAVPLSNAEMTALDEAIGGFQTAILGFLADVRGNPGESLISVLASLEQSEDTLTEAELVAGMANLFFGGHHTSVLYLGNGLLALLRHPEQAHDLREDPAIAATAAEELLRFDSPAQTGAARYATADIELHSQTIRAGDKVLLLVGSANRDPDTYSDPDRLDLRRLNPRPLTLGRGIHTCIGAPLARMEGELAFPAILRAFPKLRLADEHIERSDHSLFRGVRALRVRAD